MHKQKQKLQRQKRIRSKVQGTEVRPRLSVFRSNQHMYVQVVDDVAGKTIFSMSDAKEKGAKSVTAMAMGKQLAATLKEKKITQVVFDKGSYRYHGRVKAVAEGVREGGITV